MSKHEPNIIDNNYIKQHQKNYNNYIKDTNVSKSNNIIYFEVKDNGDILTIVYSTNEVLDYKNDNNKLCCVPLNPRLYNNSLVLYINNKYIMCLKNDVSCFNTIESMLIEIRYLKRIIDVVYRNYIKNYKEKK